MLVPDFRELGDDHPEGTVEVFEPVEPKAGAIRAARTGRAQVSVIARVLGRVLSIWLEGTCIPDEVRRSLAYGDGAAITAPESITVARRTRRTARRRAGRLLPAAFALLAAHAVATFTDLQQRAATAHSGDGWYLAAVPVAPSWPVELEPQVTTAGAHRLRRRRRGGRIAGVTRRKGHAGHEPPGR